MLTIPELYTIFSNRRELLRVLLLSWTTLFTVSCAIDPDANYAPVTGEVLSNSLLCGEDIRSSRLQWIDDIERLEHRYAKINAQNEEPQITPRIDFASGGVVLIAMGPQPSTGYRLNLATQQPLRLVGATLLILVDWQEPEPDSVQAQVTTSPCLLLNVAKQDIHRLQVIDRDNNIRLNSAI